MAKKIYNSTDELIGNTPMLKLNNIEKVFNLKANIYAKLEMFNPAGSIKDRVAKSMLDDAESKGLINKDTVIIEPTSGNTGIGLASICAIRGYRLIIVMPETMSIERRKIMSAYGAELILTKGSLGMKGAIEKANQIKSQIENSFIVGQFDNMANPKAHKNTTGVEIYNQLDGDIDILVAGIGTGGTITGTGEYLKSKISNIKIVGIEPASSPFLTKGQVGAHAIQGIGAGFIPNVLNTSIYNEVIAVENECAFETAKIMGKKEGLLIGISSGAALYGAIKLAKLPENEGKNIVVIFADSGDRYLSTELFN